MGGGFDTFIKALDADPILVDTVYLACNRYTVSKALNEGVPKKDHPTRDDLEGFRIYTDVDEDLAWTELYPELCMWLADYNRKRNAEGEDKDGEIRINF